MHSVSLGTDPPLSKPQPCSFFCPPPQALKNLISPPRQTKSPDNSTIKKITFTLINTDFRTAYKHVLILSSVIQGI